MLMGVIYNVQSRKPLHRVRLHTCPFHLVYQKNRSTIVKCCFTHSILCVCLESDFKNVLTPTLEGTSPTLGYMSKVHVLDRYKIVGFISSGTYGRVYKAVGINGIKGDFAIKKYDSVP